VLIGGGSYVPNLGEVQVFYDYPNPTSPGFNRYDVLHYPLGPFQAYQQACFGFAVDVGRLNDDGYMDLAIGATFRGNGVYGGEVWVYQGGSSFPSSPLQLTAIPADPSLPDIFGCDVVWIDYDGDANHLDDLLIGAEQYGISGGDGRVFLRKTGPPITWAWFDDPTPESGLGTHWGRSLTAGYLDNNSREDAVIGNEFGDYQGFVNAGEIRVVIYQ